MTFFPTPQPSWFSNGWDWSTTGCGLFHSGDTVTIKSRKTGWGATAYTVRDYRGNVVSSGAISGDSFNPAAPGGGWPCGWYRVYATGPSTDPNVTFGNSYGSGNFCVVPTDSRFITAPARSSYAGGVGNNEYQMKAAYGAGSSRITLGDISALTGDANLTTLAADIAVATAAWTNPGSQYLDPGRTRYVWIAIAGQSWDKVTLNTFGECYIKDTTVDGTTTFCSIGAGSVSGAKIQVFSPNNSTLVETYDNLATRTAAAAAINGVSNYVYFNGLSSDTPGTKAATAIGNTYRSNLTSIVQTAYPLGVTYFEGPYNEPGINAWTAQIMKLFYQTVKAAAPSAKVIGPCSVDIGPNLSGWDAFLAAGGGSWVDEFSTHDYNAQVAGDLNVLRNNILGFRAKLAQYGFGSTPCWQTEANNTWISAVGVLTPPRANFNLSHFLVWEQNGTAREKNSPWYDLSHGFNTYPAWLATSDGSPNPQLPMFRILAAETWGQPHDHSLDFGAVGNSMFLGSIYKSASATTAVLLSLSYMPSSTVTLQVSGASSPLTVVDSFGNTSTVAISGGQAVIPVSETPTYVRLGAGATATVAEFNGWSSSVSSISNQAITKTIGAGTAFVYPLGDKDFLNDYANYANNYASFPNGIGGMVTSTASFPNYATMKWPNTVTLNGAVIHSGPVHQTAATLLDFDVQTSVDGGANWVTQETVNVSSDATSIAFAGNGGNIVESFWKRQWVFDVPFAAPVQANALRVYVRSASYGGEADSASEAAAPPNQAGLSWTTPYMVFQEIAALGSAPSTVISPPEKIATYNQTTATTVAKISMPRAIPPGHHILLALGFSGTSTPTVTLSDSKSNTWQTDRAANYTGTNACHAHIYSCHVTTGLSIGDTITVTYNTATSNTQIVAYEVTGMHPSAWAETGTTATSSGTTTPSSGNISPANSDLLFYACDHQVSSFLPGSNWVGLDELTWSGGRLLATGYQLAAAGTYAANGTFGAGSTAAISVEAYIAAPTITWQIGLSL